MHRNLAKSNKCSKILEKSALIRHNRKIRRLRSVRVRPELIFKSSSLEFSQAELKCIGKLPTYGPTFFFLLDSLLKQTLKSCVNDHE